MNIPLSYQAITTWEMIIISYAAKECYEKALIIKKNIFGEGHGDVAACHNNLRDFCHAFKLCIEGDECSNNAYFKKKQNVL